MTSNSQIITNKFWSRTKIMPSGCVEWTGYRHNAQKGYGRFKFAGKRMLAHRWAYQWANGPDSIPDGLQLDHLCRNTMCVAPDHLEPVTHTENVRRGTAWDVSGSHNAAKTHCSQGHPYDQVNTYYRPDKVGRKCRSCNALTMARARARKEGETG